MPKKYPCSTTFGIDPEKAPVGFILQVLFILDAVFF